MSATLLPPSPAYTAPALDAEAVLACIDRCHRAVAACEACADESVLDPRMTWLASQLRSELNTAGVCRATARALTRRGQDVEDAALAQVSACAEVCALTVAGCRRYADADEVCRWCLRACRDCHAACVRLLEG